MRLNTKTESIIKTSLLSAVFTLFLFALVNYLVNRSWNIFPSNVSALHPFTVEGTGSATATPDQAQISFTVSKTAAKLEDAQNDANTAANSIVNDLQNAGIQKNDIKTGNYNSRPDYADNTSPSAGVVARALPIPTSGNSTKILSYTVDENIDVTVHDIAKANNVIDIATNGGAENIYGPNLTFSENEQQKLATIARTAAINSAKQKAENMAAAAGIQLGKILSIQENNMPFPVQPMVMSGKAESGSTESAPTQINPGENTVTENITLSYETR